LHTQSPACQVSEGERADRKEMKRKRIDCYNGVEEEHLGIEIYVLGMENIISELKYMY
jgi:hypothetical protein